MSELTTSILIAAVFLVSIGPFLAFGIYLIINFDKRQAEIAARKKAKKEKKRLKKLALANTHS